MKIWALEWVGNKGSLLALEYLNHVLSESLLAGDISEINGTLFGKLIGYHFFAVDPNPGLGILLFSM